MNTMTAHTDPRTTDKSVFPDPVYKETVLKPLFDGAKAHHVDGFRRIDRAHLVMLAATGILDAYQARDIGKALVAIDDEIDVDALTYTGEVEDFFFLIEKELKARLGPDLGGRLHTARSRNDIDHTLFKFGLKARIDPLLARLMHLIDTLIDKAEAEKALHLRLAVRAVLPLAGRSPGEFGCLWRALQRFTRIEQGLNVHTVVDAGRCHDEPPVVISRFGGSADDTSRQMALQLSRQPC